MKFLGASIMQRAAEEISWFLEQETRDEIQEIEKRMEEVRCADVWETGALSAQARRQWKNWKPGGSKTQMAQVNTDYAQAQHLHMK